MERWTNKAERMRMTRKERKEGKMKCRKRITTPKIKLQTKMRKSRRRRNSSKRCSKILGKIQTTTWTRKSLKEASRSI